VENRQPSHFIQPRGALPGQAGGALPGGRPPATGWQSPYWRYGLSRNPFGELTRGQRAELAVVDATRWLEQLRQPRFALQFLGPCGHGKTTHLLALEKLLPQSAYVYFPEEGDQPPLPRVRPLLVDEAQRLKFWRRRQLVSRPGPLVLATHVDLSPHLQRGGFAVETVDLAAPQTAQRLLEILAARIAAARLPNSSQAGTPADAANITLTIALDQVVAWQQRFGSNIRALEEFLFEDLQRSVQENRPWPHAT
jgi:hypothetical protein